MTRALITYRNAATADWSEERTERLKQLWADGLTCSQIARALGDDLTRNAVMGKVYRLKLKPRRPPGQKSSSPPRRRNGVRPARTSRELGTAIKLGAAKKHGARSLDEALKRAKGNPRAAVGQAWEALPETAPIPLLMASDETCRWPIGDPLKPGFGFCGCAVDAGSVYCATHRAIGTTTFRATAEDKRKLDRLDRSRRVFA